MFRLPQFWLSPLLVLAGLLPLSLTAEEPEWTLVWSDEFEGDELDFSKWAVEENGHGGGNDELQYYLDRPQNVRVENGLLILEAHREPINIAGVVREYSSGRIRSKRRASWTYGRFEVRARFPRGRGLWPAVWMLPEDARYGGWAASGEIDIVEFLGQSPNTAHGSLHFGGEWPHNTHITASTQKRRPDFSEASHTFALEWAPDEIRWYVDDRLYHKTREWHSTKGPFPAPFDQPFHLILNLAVGGRWPGNPDPNTAFPAQMVVDWVRVYQKLPTSGSKLLKTALP